MTCRTSEVAVCRSNELGEFARALPLSLEQPHILDCNDRLVGEGLDQLDLLVSERPYGSALQKEHAYWNPFAKKWHAEDGTKVAKPCDFTKLVFWIGKNIRNLNGFALQQNSANCTAASRRKCQMRLVFLELRRVPVACCYVVARVLAGRTEDYTLVGFA